MMEKAKKIIIISTNYYFCKLFVTARKRSILKYQNMRVREREGERARGRWRERWSEKRDPIDWSKSLGVYIWHVCCFSPSFFASISAGFFGFRIAEFGAHEYWILADSVGILWSVCHVQIDKYTQLSLQQYLSSIHYSRSWRVQKSHT